MRTIYFALFLFISVLFSIRTMAQSNNALSIYEGERIKSVAFEYVNLPIDSIKAKEQKQKIENSFLVYPYSHFNEFQITYYLSQIKNLPFVENATFNVTPQGDGGFNLILNIDLAEEGTVASKRSNLFKNPQAFPIIYADPHSLLTFKLSASEMAYSNNNAWFAQPAPLLTGNPMADNAVGKGYTGWLEGFTMGGIYGITRLIPKRNFHLYGGASYILSFSAGRELFTDKSRFHGEVEEAFVGFIGGRKYAVGHDYSYSMLYGRKQFVLGNGWLIINTSMNGQERAALQINPRWAARSLFLADARWDKLRFQFFQVRPNELPIFYSRTILNGLNLELGSSDRIQLGTSVIHSPRSDMKYYLPDGTVQQRKGLWVYNLRFYGNPSSGRSGMFYKAEGGYQTNRDFKMRAYAWYTQLGWNFATTSGKPALSYRFAYFSGDNPRTKAYERWDALYTGGTGEQWVQGSNMYKIVQNSNEMSHLMQLIYTPIPKIQTVTQLWSFMAPQTNNLGGNPVLSVMKSRYYGTELNLTIKYFHSRHWYFHLNTALTFPGNAIKDIVPNTRDWFCLMAFVRYSL
ncbi:MAG: alginate export family protein [Bacteroidaceae bacterium]